MNILCKVCGEKAAGFHFGAFTCEGCKSFFGRCCNNASIIGECRNNNGCVINKKNRTSCKPCRLQKCVMAGMSKSGSRYGRRSNWFKQFFQENESSGKMCEDERDNTAAVTNAAAAIIPIVEIPVKTSITSPRLPIAPNPNGDSSHFYVNYFPYLSLDRLSVPIVISAKGSRREDRDDNDNGPLDLRVTKADGKSESRNLPLDLSVK